MLNRKTLLYFLISSGFLITLLLFVQNRMTQVVDPCQKQGATCALNNADYLNESLSVEERIDDLMARMTTDEKIGQLALIDKKSVFFKQDIERYGLGGLLSGAGSKPDPNTVSGWREMVDSFQEQSQKTRLKIPLLYGVDAIHGHTNVPGATVFPHSIGLGASHDADLVRRIGQITAEEMTATGIYWNFGPSVDVVDDVRWGRTYETFGDDAERVTALGTAYLEGLQSGLFPIIGTAKHFLGTGAMKWGYSDNPDFKIDQGVTFVDESTLRSVHLPPFVSAVKAGVKSVMVGHMTWNGVELAANRYLLTDVLKGELGFDGFVVSDWYGVYEIPGGKYQATVSAINAGVDMVMLPYDYKTFIRDMQKALEQGDITNERLNDAVRRILRGKFAAGLFRSSKNEDSALQQFGSMEHKQVAREAVQKSLVLLKNNENLLPLSKSTKKIYVSGSSAHNLGRQSGGWTIEWQGIDGNWIEGTTILDAIKQSVSKETTIVFNENGDFSSKDGLADVGIAVVGEAPYAEGWGDEEHPELTSEDKEAIKKLGKMSKKLVVILVSGRPLDIKKDAKNWESIVAAWLPGTEGAGITDVLFGDVEFTGMLPVKWELE